MFHFLIPTDWVLFQNLTYGLMCSRNQVNCKENPVYVSCEFAAFMSWTYWFSKRKITSSNVNKELPGLDRLLMQKQRLRTRNPARKMQSDWSLKPLGLWWRSTWTEENKNEKLWSCAPTYVAYLGIPFLPFNVITFIASFLRGATQGNVTSQPERTVPEMTHAQPWLPSPTADPHSHDCYMNTSYSMHNTQSRLPVNDNDVVTSIATIGTFEAVVFF